MTSYRHRRFLRRIISSSTRAVHFVPTSLSRVNCLHNQAIKTSLVSGQYGHTCGDDSAEDGFGVLVSEEAVAGGVVVSGSLEP